MCGIVGMSLRRGVDNRYKHIQKLKDTFTGMLVAAQKRGSAATGIVVMARTTDLAKPKAYVLRAPLPAEDFVQTPEYKQIMTAVNGSTLSIIGHTRAVSSDTAPAEENLNNHPHISGKIVGVHNGRVFNDVRLWKRYSAYLQPKSTCDSEIIFALINRKLQLTPSLRTEAAVSDAISELDMNYALALVNMTKPGQIYLARGAEKDPLYLMWHNESQVALFASSTNYIRDNWKIKDGFLTRYHVPVEKVVTLDAEHPGEKEDFYVKIFDCAKKSLVTS